jgi:hypothetical protein
MPAASNIVLKKPLKQQSLMRMVFLKNLTAGNYEIIAILVLNLRAKHQP